MDVIDKENNLPLNTEIPSPKAFDSALQDNIVNFLSFINVLNNAKKKTKTKK